MRPCTDVTLLSLEVLISVLSRPEPRAKVKPTIQANQLQITCDWFKADQESGFPQKGKSILKLLVNKFRLVMTA